MPCTKPVRPAFTAKDAERITRERFGLEARAEELPGELYRNFHLKSAAGRRKVDAGPLAPDADGDHVLKIAPAGEPLEVVDFQNQALERLAALEGDPVSPRVCRTVSGEMITQVESRDGTAHHVRLLTYLPGVFLADFPSHTPELLTDLGRFFGRLDRALEGFAHPAMVRPIPWNLKRVPAMRAQLPHIPSRNRRYLAEHFLDRFEDRALPALACLRESVIHNDGNDRNVLVADGGEGRPAVKGVIDFNDMVHTCTVCEPAIAAAYAAMGKEDPLEAAARVLAGYHEVHPLTEEEVAVFFDLICGRLCSSVCMSALQQKREPENDYLRISEAPAWALLEKLVAVEPERADGLFSRALGMDPGSPAAHRGASSREVLDKDELLALRRRHVGRSLSVSYQKPLKIVKGFMQYLYDEEGRPYLDTVNNVSHVGHCHPRVVRAAGTQMAALNTNTRYLHDYLVRYARRLCRTMPHPLEVCFFVNSGSEANDLALRLAWTHTGRRDVVVVGGAYHGNLSSLIDISPYKFDGPGGSGAPPHVHNTPMPDGYRGPYKGHGPEAGARYAGLVKEALEKAEARSGGAAAFICESFLSCGGQVVPPAGYLKEAARHAREAGAVYIADEVQVGFGRAGTHRWAFETQDVVPDIVTLGKPMGNGHPLAALVTSAEIAGSFQTGMEYFNTYGGNPVSCAVGMAVLDVLEEDRLQENAQRVGAKLKAGLIALQERHALIGHVRGQGLFLGTELVRDRESLAPATAEAAWVTEAMKEKGILMSTDGPFANVLKIKPPLVFTEEDADVLVRTLDRVLGAQPEISSQSPAQDL